ncbi:MAG TPA: ABC transporter ATP-binding protein, partial [Candidatus Paceibacterota bacterium]|nr:ABC transporter ATP-binding protein [Candidatus Paceibacterota bacterium]
GTFVSLMGPSGCGKSTLLRIIAGLETPEKGAVERGFKELSMVFQNHAIFPWLTVRENAAFGLEMKGVPLAERNRIAEEKLREVGLIGPDFDLSNSYPNQLSGGQKQRVSVARALAVAPEILLMDEPFSSLDSITAERLKTDIFRLFKKYNMTVVMVNHLIEDAIELSDEIIVLSKAPGTVKEKIRVDLPYPRDNRSTHFFSLVDKVRSLIEE